MSTDAKLTVRLGTRGSDLALWQAHMVAERLASRADVELVIIETKGDRVQDRPLIEVGGTSVFTAEIERALLDGRIDLAVHSHKDLGTLGPEGLVVAAVPERGPQHELLVMSPKVHLPDAAFLPLRAGARVGTGAPRRVALLAALRPDLVVEGLRGNVPTRVDAVRQGRLDAVAIAAAGLLRLQLDTQGLVVAPLDMDVFVPAPGQGALAIQVRQDDRDVLDLCRSLLHDEGVARIVAAERSLLVSAGRGCDLPLGVAITPDDARTTSASSAARVAWRARVFLGAGHPAAGAPSRWAEARGTTPDEAAAAAWMQLQTCRPTTCGPMSGLRVAICGAIGAGTGCVSGGGTRLGRRLSELGVQVFEEDLLVVEPLMDVDLSGPVASLRPGDLLAITSRHAATRMHGLRLPAGVDVVAVGQTTAAVLRAAGHEPRLVGTAGAAELARRVLDDLRPERGARVLFPCSESARPELPRLLGAAGLRVEPLVIYRVAATSQPTLADDVHARVYMSPSAVAASRAQGREDAGGPLRIPLGVSTRAALQDAGLACADATDDADDMEAAAGGVAVSGHAAVLAALAPLSLLHCSHDHPRTT